MDKQDSSLWRSRVDAYPHRACGCPQSFCNVRMLKMCALESDYECYCETRTTHKTARVLFKQCSWLWPDGKIVQYFSQVYLRRQIHAKKRSHPPFKMLKATGFPAVMVCSEGESQGEKSSIREDTAQRQHSSTRLESQDVWKACLHTRVNNPEFALFWITYLFLLPYKGFII